MAWCRAAAMAACRRQRVWWKALGWQTWLGRQHREGPPSVLASQGCQQWCDSDRVPGTRTRRLECPSKEMSYTAHCVQNWWWVQRHQQKQQDCDKNLNYNRIGLQYRFRHCTEGSKTPQCGTLWAPACQTISPCCDNFKPVSLTLLVSLLVGAQNYSRL